eukprot:3228638-Prymnesium_polylepis.2
MIPSRAAAPEAKSCGAGTGRQAWAGADAWKCGLEVRPAATLACEGGRARPHCGILACGKSTTIQAPWCSVEYLAVAKHNCETVGSFKFHLYRLARRNPLSTQASARSASGTGSAHEIPHGTAMKRGPGDSKSHDTRASPRGRGAS